ncbi:MAG: hypothetical protein ACYCXA_06605 [Actinomycetes bacterium]
MELPVSYARQIATEGLVHEVGLEVTRLGAGVVIHTAPAGKDRLPIVVGYATARSQWHRDGRRHIEASPVEEPGKATEVWL